MKPWSKCGLRSSLSRCCIPSPSTSCPASAPRTSAAPPTRLCTSKPMKPLWTPTVASHPHVSSCRVKELSHHFSEMNPVRQKWIYTFFMYPFLSGDRINGKRPVKWPLKYVAYSSRARFPTDDSICVWHFCTRINSKTNNNSASSLFTGCVRRNETTEDWLMKNFGAFKAMARLEDFSTLNMAFSGVSSQSCF